MDKKQLESISHVDKVVIYKLIGTSKWLLQYMKDYEVSIEQLSAKTEFSPKKVRAILEGNTNLTIQDIAVLEVAIGDLVKEKIRLLEITKD